MKIMVVDDCRTTRKLITLYLKSRGFNVVCAENGLDALERLATEDVNIILSDINMPYMDGIEFLKTLRADPKWSDIPVFMVTTEADSEEKEKAYSAGASEYLVKPVTAEDVVKVIRKLLKDTFSRVG
jgi:two-component system chemotaxis response regulator CheY